MKKYYYEGPAFKLWRGSSDPTSNYKRGPGVPLLNFREIPGPTFKLWGGPGSWCPGPTFTPWPFSRNPIWVSFFGGRCIDKKIQSLYYTLVPSKHLHAPGNTRKSVKYVQNYENMFNVIFLSEKIWFLQQEFKNEF